MLRAIACLVVLLPANCGRHAADPRGGAAAVREIADSTFAHHVLRSEAPVVVEYWARWCAPCRKLAPHVESVASEYAGSVTFCKLNVGWNAASRERYRIHSVPTLVLYEHGREMARLVGMPSDSADAQLRNFVESGLKTSR